jgi:hypothetical protein
LYDRVFWEGLMLEWRAWRVSNGGETSYGGLGRAVKKLDLMMSR